MIPHDKLIFSLRLDIYETLRYVLKMKGLIKGGPKAKNLKCNGGWKNNMCFMCGTTHICAEKVL